MNINRQLVKPPTDRLNKWFATKFNITINEESMDSQHQTLHFADQMPHWRYTVDSPLESTYNICDNSQDDLASFFSRPLKVATYEWAVGSVLFETFNPWSLFFNNPRVINRVSNYMNLRCKLHVKFILNGNGFHYGRAIASYNPLHTLDNITKDRAFFIQDIIEASQRPKIFLDPTKSKGGELTLPFFWYNNNLCVPRAEWDDMGEIIIHGINPLKHANGSMDSVNVSVFVWAEDVVLSIPTVVDPGALVPQSGDEYGTGPLSRPLSTISRFAGSLMMAPIIAPYAKAIQMGTSLASGVAQLFGYSRPNVIADILPYRPIFAGNMVNTQYPDTAVKLTNDPKQELTIDTRTFGLGSDDEMTIKSIAMRESYLTSFNWSTAAVTEQFLFQVRVTPCLYDRLTLGTLFEHHLTAACFATLPFARWRGTTKFRFQIVASAYHKGRLKVVYEPYAVTGNEYNTNYVHIIDLAKERDFSIDIGWGLPTSFCNTTGFLASVPFETGAPSSVPTYPELYSNGYLSIYVVNELTTPNSTVNNDISVNVFTCMCDDFEVADPTDIFISDLSVFPPPQPLEAAAVGEEVLVGNIDEPQTELEFQSGVETTDTGMISPDGDRNDMEDIPSELSPTHLIAPKLSADDHTLDVYFGDPITSFRQVLKRYNYYTTYALSFNPTLYEITIPNFPEYRGYAPDGFMNTTGPIPYNFNKNTLLNYVSSAYGARRGSIRWKALLHGTAQRTLPCTVTRLSNTPFDNHVRDFSAINVGIATGSAGIRTQMFVDNQPSMIEGSHVVLYGSAPVLEYELPFFDTARFHPCKRVTALSATDLNALHRLTMHAYSVQAESPAVQNYVSIGEDFTLGFYLGPPVFYRYSNPPGISTPYTN